MSFDKTSRRRRLLAQLIAILAIFSLIAAACGDDDEDADDDSTDQTTDSSDDGSDDSSDDGGEGPDDLDPDGTLQFLINFETWFGTGFDPATAIYRRAISSASGSTAPSCDVMATTRTPRASRTSMAPRSSTPRRSRSPCSRTSSSTTERR